MKKLLNFIWAHWDCVVLAAMSMWFALFLILIFAHITDAYIPFPFMMAMAFSFTIGRMTSYFIRKNY